MGSSRGKPRDLASYPVQPTNITSTKNLRIMQKFVFASFCSAGNVQFSIHRIRVRLLDLHCKFQGSSCGL